MVKSVFMKLFVIMMRLNVLKKINILNDESMTCVIQSVLNSRGPSDESTSANQNRMPKIAVTFRTAHALAESVESIKITRKVCILIYNIYQIFNISFGYKVVRPKYSVCYPKS